MLTQNNCIRYLLAIALFFSLSICGYAGQSVLDNRVSIHIQGVSLENALEIIESEGGVMFSYNPETLPVDSLVSVNEDQTPISNILHKLVGAFASFKVIGEIVVIKALPALPAKKQNVNVSGNLRDLQTGEKIEDATVFVIGSAEAVLTNSSGNYDLDVTSKDEYVEVYYSKPNYRDTVVVVKASEADSAVVFLRPLDIDIDKIKQDVKDEIYDVLGNVKLFVDANQIKLTENIKHVQIPGQAQVSFVPNVGTNGRLNGNTLNHASLNIIGGYSGGLQGIEIGGITNIDAGDVTGLQISGIVNVDAAKLQGLQIAGVNNVVKGNVFGAQIAGLNNVAVSKVYGLQLAGFTNISRDTLYGMQLAGFANIATGRTIGNQTAGFSNVVSNNFTGIQFAAFSNHAANVDGLQVAAFVNSAKRVRGVQLGLINYADTVQGVSIGFLNIVKKGFIAIELERSDVFDGALLFKTGTNWFYNIFSLGYIEHNSIEFASVGYGLGTRYQKKDGILSGDFEIVYNSILELQNQELVQKQPQHLLNVSLGMGVDFWKVFTLHAGPVIRAQYQSSTLRISDISPEYSTTFDSNNFDSWLGWNASLRIRL